MHHFLKIFSRRPPNPHQREETSLPYPPHSALRASRSPPPGLVLDPQLVKRLLTTCIIAYQNSGGWIPSVFPGFCYSQIGVINQSSNHKLVWKKCRPVSGHCWRDLKKKGQGLGERSRVPTNLRPPVRTPGFKTRIRPPYPQRVVKGDFRNGTVSRNNRIKRVVPCRCRTGTLKKPTKCLWRWEPDRRYNFFFSPPAHLYVLSHIWLKYRVCDVKEPVHLTSHQL